MEETDNPKITFEELLKITVVILSSLGINEEKEIDADLPLVNAINTLQAFKVTEINEDEDLNHFSYFIKNLFLDDEGNVDLDINELSKSIPNEYINEIFKSLLKELKAKQFFSFIFSLGEIFTSMYYKSLINEEILNEFEKKCINNYEIILKIISRCKNNKSCEFFYMNYDVIFSRRFFFEVKSKFVNSLQLYFNLCIASTSPKDELKFDKDSNSHNTTVELENKFESSNNQDLIYKYLKLFWCNSFFRFESIVLDDFMNFIYDFITQKKSHIVIDNNYDISSKKFLKYISYPLQNLINNYDDNSFIEFKEYLNNFVKFNQNEESYFIKKALSILSPDDEDVGLLSFYCLDKAKNEFLQKITNSLQDMSEESIKDICNNYGLDEYEELILRDIINKKIENLKLNEMETLSEINSQNNDDNYTAKSKQKEVLYPKEIAQLSKEKISSNEKNFENYDNIFNSVKKIIETQQFLKEQINSQNEEYKLLQKQMNDLVGKNKLLQERMKVQMIAQNEKYNLLQQKMDAQRRKSNLLQKQMDAQVGTNNLLEQQINAQVENNKLLHEQINSLIIKVDELENLHKGIFFTDISKFYIDTFCKKYNIEGNDTFHRCATLLKMDYNKKNLNEFKKTIYQIAQHYIEGNKPTIWSSLLKN